jgi:CheY-like chemotaxis protein
MSANSENSSKKNRKDSGTAYGIEMMIKEGEMLMMEIDKPEDNWALSGKRFLPESAIKDEMDKTMEQYTVFLVEDDCDDREQAVQTLRKSPYIYNIHCFKTGDDLIKHFAGQGYYTGNPVRYIPTLIILDIHVPGSDGLETLRDLKYHPLTEDIPVIILTGDTSNKAALDAYKFNANAFIAKPLNLDQVHEVIHKGRAWPHKR